MTKTPQDRAASGDSIPPAIDRVPGSPPVPLTVWRTPGSAGDGPIGARLAYRLLAAYSTPGDTVVDLTGTATILAAATTGQRSLVQAVFTAAHAIVVTATIPPSTRAGRGGRPRRTLAASGDPPALADWFGDDLRDPDRPAGTLGDAPQPAPGSGDVGLLVAPWPLHLTPAVGHRRLATLLDAAAAVLPPAGCVAFVAAPGGSGEYTALVQAASAAGLRYLQHIVAVHADTEGDRFVYHADARDLPATSTGAHTTVHSDLLVFIVPGGARG